MKIVYGVLFAVIYTVVYVFLAMLVTGGGHGNFIGMIPVNITWLLNFAALISLTQLKYKIIKILFVVMMFAYYAWLFFMLSEASTNKKMITHPYAGQLLIPAVWFITGQIVIWAMFIKKVVNQEYES